MNGLKFILICAVAVIVFLLAPCAESTEEYAEKTGLSCERCHLDASGGGELTEAGEEYLKWLSQEPEIVQKEQPPVKRSRFAKYIRFISGWLHMLTAIFWFGTILYVHLILKPAYASHGLPRGEVRVGLVSMVIIGVTGLVLALYRVPSLSFLLETRFGILLLVKIAIFLVMVLTALFAVFFLGPRLKKGKQTQEVRAGNRITADELKSFDGNEARPAYFAYRGQIYDLTHSNFWDKGLHFGRHRAGEDLTDFLEQAPHGEEKILPMPRVAELVLSEPTRGIFEKIFYFLAYFNLVAVFLIILILALWRWW